MDFALLCKGAGSVGLEGSLVLSETSARCPMRKRKFDTLLHKLFKGRTGDSTGTNTLHLHDLNGACAGTVA